MAAQLTILFVGFLSLGVFLSAGVFGQLLLSLSLEKLLHPPSPPRLSADAQPIMQFLHFSEKVYSNIIILSLRNLFTHWLTQKHPRTLNWWHDFWWNWIGPRTNCTWKFWVGSDKLPNKGMEQSLHLFQSLNICLFDQLLFCPRSSDPTRLLNAAKVLSCFFSP